MIPFYMHALPLYVNILFIHLFICCLFFLFLFSRFYHMCFPFLSCVFSVYDLLFKTSIWKICIVCLLTLLFGTFTALFVFACLSFLSFFLQKGFHFCCYSCVFLNILLFCLHSLISVFPLFLVFLPLLNVCLF